jgi:hypothetical protein
MLADQDRSFIAKEGDLKTKLMLSVFFFPIGPRPASAMRAGISRTRVCSFVSFSAARQKMKKPFP